MPAAVKVRVPATVANLGPGFDALGVAVRMHLEIDIEPRRESVDILIEGEGAEHLPADETNLVIKSMNTFFDFVGRRPPGYAVRVKNPIPLGSGLGSSAAAVVGGLYAARSVTGRTVPQTEMVQLATKLEGHPDNVMPALLGGLVVCYRSQDGSEVRSFRLEPSERLIPIIAVPAEGFPTSEARKALPEDVSFGDAQFTASRAALLVAAMTSGSGSDVLAEAMNDRLHEPHRLKLMPETAAVHEELRSAGLAVALAGAGPSLLTVVPKPEAATRAEQVRRVCRERHAGWRVFVSEWEPKGARASA
ncbi:MAG TPA: homoserine kinase [Actinomycetota bacterium]|jgi:homoserine kinase|nr:homoserine kinase [Actinomycetota bacterium]